jgi:RNA polymerase sigma factor (sigma-70 family)
MDESQLWSAALGGDGHAFGRIFDTHQARVLRHAAHIVDERQDAEDVAATAFFELWRLRRKVRLVNGSILPWLLATTTNVARNTSRSTRRYNRVLRSLPRDQDSSYDVADLIDTTSRETREALKKSLQAMAPVDAALLTLTALEGLSTADAARAVGIKPNTARVRLHRAKANARQTLQTKEAVS